MPMTSLRGGGTVQRLYTPSGSAGQQLTAAGSSNTKGGYTAISSSISADLVGLHLIITNSSGNGRDFLLDLAVGAASSEVVVVDNILYSPGSDDLHTSIYLPLALAKGQRLAARIASSTSNSTCKIAAWGITRSFLVPIGFGRCTTYGAVTGDSGGTGLDPGTSADTKSAWTALSTSTNRIRALIVMIGNARNNNQISLYEWVVDIGVGASGSEVVVVPDLAFQCDVASDGRMPNVFGPFAVDIPAGSRLSARTAIGIGSADSTDRAFDVIVYGFN